jgi:hypothetical protein
MKKALLGLVALVWAGTVCLIGFVFFGALLPMWIMIAAYGTKAVQDAPGHGGIILFLTLPLAGLGSIVAFLFLAMEFHAKLIRMSELRPPETKA